MGVLQEAAFAMLTMYPPDTGLQHAVLDLAQGSQWSPLT